LPDLFLSLAFGIGMTKPFQSVNLYLWYSWLDMEWFIEFALLFSSKGGSHQRYMHTFGFRVR